MNFRPRAALIAVTLLWGSTFVVIQSGLDVIAPFQLIAVRFGVATLALTVWRPRAAVEAVRIAFRSLPLTVTLFLGLALQTLGLLTTTPSRSAFLSAVGVVFVPAMLILRGQHPTLRGWLGAMVAAIGVYGLFYPFELTWIAGDTLTLLGAVAFSYSVIDLERVARIGTMWAVVIVQMASLALFGAIAALALDVPRFDVGNTELAMLLYLGVICSAVTFALMTWGQSLIRPSEAAVIYTLEPLVATVFSVMLGREGVSPQLIFGGGLILGAILVAAETPVAGLDPSPSGGVSTHRDPDSDR